MMIAAEQSTGAWLSDHTLTILGLVIAVVGIPITIFFTRDLAIAAWKNFVRLTRSYWAVPIAAILAALILWLDRSHRAATAASVLFVTTILGLAAWCQHLLSKNKRLLPENERLLSEKVDSLAENERLLSNNKLLLSENERLLSNNKSLATRIPWDKDDPNHRWEELRNITYGCLPYPKFLSDPEEFGHPTGFGLEMLQKLFDPEIKRDGEFLKIGEWVNWGNVLKELTDKKYRIVATPLFATFDRSKDARFTAPLFYSNIGLYVSKEMALDHGWGEGKLDFKEMCKIMKSSKEKGLLVLSVKGEISEKLAKKYAHQDSIQGRADDTFKLAQRFAEIAHPDSNPQENPEAKPCAMFCESYFGSLQKEVKGKNPEVVNILAPHQILYPVCFAVRVGDYQLANLLNIRLLAQAQENRPLDILIDRLVPPVTVQGLEPLNDEERKKEEEREEKVKEISKHFIAEWPVTKPASSENHNA